jgi:DNA-binding NarL/FixJ family response regulator
MNVILPSLRVLLVDDSPLFLEAAVQALAADPRIEVVGSALSGQEGVVLVAQRQPDLVLVDVAMPGMNGMETTRRIKAQPNAPHVVVLTSYDQQHYRAAAKAVGADNFICKSDFDTQLRPLLEILLAERNASLS